MDKLKAFILIILVALSVSAYVGRGVYTDVFDDGNNKFGRNVDIDTGGFETIWDGGGIWVPPTAARIHDIASTSALDTAAGTGARTLRVYCADASWDRTTEDIVLDGTTNVAMVTECWSIDRIKVLTAGSTGANQGNITATARTDGTVTAQITNLSSVGFNQTLMAPFTVPRGHRVFIKHVQVGMNRSQTSGSADFALWVKEMDESGVGVWQLKDFGGMVAGGTSNPVHPFDPPFMIQGPAHVRLDADASANNTDVVGRIGYRQY